MLKKGLVLLLFLFSPLAMAELSIAPYFAKYEVLYNGIKLGELTQKLSPVVEGRQALQSRAYTTGLAAMFKSDTVTQLSLWLREKGRDLPLSYTYHYDGSRKSRFEQQKYDWPGSRVKSLRDGVETMLELEPGTFDIHMVQIALRKDLSRGLKEITYPVIDRSQLKRYTFKVLGEESLATEALGKLRCVKLQRGSTRLWLAQKLDYLPIKIEKDDDGTTVTSRLIEFKGDQ